MESRDPEKLDYASPPDGEENRGVGRYYREPPELGHLVFIAACAIMLVLLGCGLCYMIIKQRLFR